MTTETPDPRTHDALETPPAAPEAPGDGSDPADVYAETPPSPERRRRALWAGLALLVLVTAVGLTWTLARGDSSDAVAEAPPAAPLGTANEEAVEGGLAQYDLNGDGVVYQSGMHPYIVQDEPGQFPVCGMDLEPVPVSGAPAGTVEIDPVTLQNIGVRTALVQERQLERTLRTSRAPRSIVSPSHHHQVGLDIGDMAQQNVRHAGHGLGQNLDLGLDAVA